MKKWFEDAWWSWGNCIYFRFDEYVDNIDRLAFFCEISYGWYQMEDEYHMSQPGFDFWNLKGRDLYYSYKVSNK
jgi:hypothetical protein